MRQHDVQAPDVRLVIGQAVRQADRAWRKKGTHAPPPVRAYTWGSRKNISSFFLECFSMRPLKIYKSEADHLKDLTGRWYHPWRHIVRTREEKMRLKHAVRRRAVEFFREKGKRNDEENEFGTGQGD